jgi:hypothetical protein
MAEDELVFSLEIFDSLFRPQEIENKFFALFRI